jgi:hypothetical protein
VLAVLVAIMVDFVLNQWNLEILLYYRIRHISCVCYAQSLRLEAFEFFYVGRGCGCPELYSVRPDWFQYSFVNEGFVVCRES